jgi:photosystem II stability/assembly factor-like uncharacterized protein
MNRSIGIVLLLIGAACAAEAPPFAGQWIVRGTDTTASLRGLHVVDADVAWASGSGGTFLRTVDGGANWHAGTVSGAEDLDFRDVHAWDARRALVLSAGLPARIYLTENAGESWLMVYEKTTPGVFFNAVSFWDEERGIAVGDPIDGRWLLIRTSDGGRSWSELPFEQRPEALAGEANFAASGTCLVVRGDHDVWFGSGGPAARVFGSSDGGTTWRVAATPLRAGQASQGVFSLFFSDSRNGVAVGGDYRDEANPTSTAAVTTDGGATWTPAATPPSGFRECVVPVSRIAVGVLIAVGPSGTDLSEDGGLNWRPMGAGRYHAAGFSPDGLTGIAVGMDGLAGRWAWPTD